MYITRVITSLLVASTFVTPPSRPVVPEVRHDSIREIWRGNIIEERSEFAQQMSNRCLTPYFWCFLPAYGPVGTPCWCASPNGPIAGRVG